MAAQNIWATIPKECICPDTCWCVYYVQPSRQLAVKVVVLLPWTPSLALLVPAYGNMGSFFRGRGEIKEARS